MMAEIRKTRRSLDKLEVSSPFQQQMALTSRPFRFWTKKTAIELSEVTFQPEFFTLVLVLVFKITLVCSNLRFIAFSWNYKVHLKNCVGAATSGERQTLFNILAKALKVSSIFSSLTYDWAILNINWPCKLATLEPSGDSLL